MHIRRHFAKRMIASLCTVAMIATGVPMNPYSVSYAAENETDYTSSENKPNMDESVYQSLGFNTDVENDDESFLGFQKVPLYVQNELLLDYNGSCHYGTILRDNIRGDLAITNGGDRKLAGAYERYGQYKEGDWAKLSNDNGFNWGKLGGTELYREVDSTKRHLPEAYATEVAYKSASGKDDRIAKLYVSSSTQRSNYRIYLETFKFVKYGDDSYYRSYCSYYNLGAAPALDEKGRFYNWNFDALFDITAGDYNGDGLDELAVYYADNTVKIFSTKNDRLSLIQTIEASEIQADSERSVSTDSGQSAKRAAIVTLTSGDLKKDHTEDLVISVSMPAGSSSNSYTHNNNVFIYGYDKYQNKMLKDYVIDCNGTNNTLFTNSHQQVGRATNATIGDLTGNGHNELIIGTRLGKSDDVNSGNWSVAAIKHVEYNHSSKQYQEKPFQNFDGLNGDFRKTGSDNGYAAPTAMQVVNFGSVGNSDQYVFCFDRLFKWDGSQFSNSGPRFAYSTSQRNNANEGEDKNEVWISSIMAGNVTGDKLGRQSLLAIIGVKQDSDNQYWYELCKITEIDGTFYRTWEGVLNQANSYLNRTDNKSRASAYVCLSLPDVDDDSIILDYKGSETFFTKPEVQAILQAPPYYEDVALTYDNYLQNGGTAYSTSEGDENGVQAGISASLGAYVSAEGDFFASGEMELSISATTSFDHETMWATSRSVEYATGVNDGETDDYVVMYTIPYHRYYYEYWDKEKGDYFPYVIEVPMTPSTVIVPVDTYDNLAANYKGLEPIRGNILTTTPGDPLSYMSTFSGSFDSIGDTQLLVNAGAGASNVTVSMEKDVTHTESFSVGVEEEFKAGGGGGLLGCNVRAGVVQSYGASIGGAFSNMSGSSYTGTVDNLPAGVTGYGFNWQFGVQEKKLNGETVYLIGYRTSNVKMPPRAAKNLMITGITSTSMTLEWDGTSSAAAYEVVLITNNGMELPQATIPATQANEDGSLTYVVKNLTPNTQYSFNIVSIDGMGARSIPTPAVTGTTLPEMTGSFKIVEQPDDVTAPVGDSAIFTVETENNTGSALSYLWQEYDKGTKEWNPIGGNSKKLTIKNITEEQDDSIYRCIVYVGGTLLISNIATLTIGNADAEATIKAVDTEGNRVLNNYDVVKSGSQYTQSVQSDVVKVPYPITLEMDGKEYNKLSYDTNTVWSLATADENSNTVIKYYEYIDDETIGDELPVVDKMQFVTAISSEDAEFETNMFFTDGVIKEVAEKTFTRVIPAVYNEQNELVTPEGTRDFTSNKAYETEDGKLIYIVTDTIEDAENGNYDINYYYLISASDEESDPEESDPEESNPEESDPEESDPEETIQELVFSDYIGEIEIESGTDVRTDMLQQDTIEIDQPVYVDEIFDIPGTPIKLSTAITEKLSGENIDDAKAIFQIVNTADGSTSVVSAEKSGDEYVADYMFNAPGVYQVYASFAGNNKYNPARSEGITIVVQLEEEELHIEGGRISYGTTVDLNPAIIGLTSVTKVTEPVVYTVKNSSGNEVTGMIAGNVFKPTVCDKYVITAQYDGKTATSVVDVSKKLITVKPEDMESKATESSDYKQTLLDNNNVSIDGLAFDDAITADDYSLNSMALTTTDVGDYTIETELLSTENCTSLLKNYSLVLKKATYTIFQDKVKVTAGCGANGTINIGYKLNEEANTITVESGTYIPEGSTVVITAQPATGYGIKQWTENGLVQDTKELEYVIEDATEDVEINVLFELVYNTLSFGTDGNGKLNGLYEGNANVICKSGDKINQNQKVELTAVPNEGYVVDHWTVKTGNGDEEIIYVEAGDELYTGNTYKIESMLANTEVRVYFRQIVEKTVNIKFVLEQEDVTFTAGTGVTINNTAVELKNGSYSYKTFAGDNLDIKINIPSNMLVDHWVLDGSVAANNIKNIVIHDVKEDTEYNYIVFCSNPNKREVSYSMQLDETNGNGGNIAEAGSLSCNNYDSNSVVVTQGADLKFTAKANSGYAITKWTVNGVKVTNGIETLSDGTQIYKSVLTDDVDVKVYFEKYIAYTIPKTNTSYTVSEVSRTKSDYLPQNIVRDGGTVTFTMTPVAGSKFTTLNVYGVNCLTTTSKTVTVGTQKSVVTVTAGKNNSYKIKITNVRKNILASAADAKTAIVLDKATVTVANGQTFTYNGTAQVPKSLIVKLNGTTISSDYYTATYKNNKNAGTATITVKGKGKYTGTATGTFTIKKRALTVTANNISKIVSYDDPKLTYKTSGLVSGETIKVTLKRTAGEAVGTYTIKPTVTASSNYTVTIKNGIFTIKKYADDYKWKNQLNQGLSTSFTGGKFTLKWGEVTRATGYEIYAAQCGSSYPTKPTKTITGAKNLTYSFTKLNGVALSDSKEYKMYVKAYRMVNGKKVYLTTSFTVHRAGTKAKITNASSITLKAAELTIKKGAYKTAQVSKVGYVDSTKKPLLHLADKKELVYWSTNKSVVTVDSNGKIVAVNKGTAYVYVMAVSGVKKKIKVTVN